MRYSVTISNSPMRSLRSIVDCFVLGDLNGTIDTCADQAQRVLHSSIQLTEMQKSIRLSREIKKLVEHPPEGIICYPSDQLNLLTINIIGPRGSPYEGALFELELGIPERYPFVPPRLKFITPVYHPNIDSQGLICMDLLKMPPAGGWRPTISLENLIVAVQSLLGNPNPDDPLMVDIAEEYRYNRKEFEKKARKFAQENGKNSN